MKPANYDLVKRTQQHTSLCEVEEHPYKLVNCNLVQRL